MSKLGSIDVLIELYPLVPFVLIELIAESVYIGAARAWTRARIECMSCLRRQSRRGCSGEVCDVTVRVFAPSMCSVCVCDYRIYRSMPSVGLPILLTVAVATRYGYSSRGTLYARRRSMARRRCSPRIHATTFASSIFTTMLAKMRLALKL